MGNTPHEQQDGQIFNWKQVQPNRYINKLTNQVIDHQRVQFDHWLNQEDQNTIINTYKDRIKINKAHIAKLLYYSCVNVNKRDQICFQSGNGIDVYVQGGLTPVMKIIYNHSGACLCSHVTKGFEDLKDIYGPFQVTTNMVFQDNNGNIKVWLNQNIFRNNFKPVKQSIMVLQIKEILIKLQCSCNMFLEENLTFQNLRLKSQNYGHRVSKYEKPKISHIWQQLQTQVNHQNDHISSNVLPSSPKVNKNPFYYPPSYLHRKSINHPIKFSNQQNFSHHLKQDSLSRAQKVVSNQSSTHTPQHSKADTRKNHFDYFQHASLNSTPKIKFSYENASGRGTPSRGFFNQRPQSQMSTFSQKINNNPNYADTSCSFLNSTGQITSQNKIKKRVIFVHDHSLNFQFNNIEYRKVTQTEPQTQEKALKATQSQYNTRDVSKPLQGQKKPRDSEGIQTLPFELPYYQKLMKISSAPQNHIQAVGLSQIYEPEHSSQVSLKPLDGIRRQMIYQNSYTDRSINEDDKIDTPRQKQSQPQNNPRVQYRVPQKTKLLIQKYMSQKQSSKSSSDKSSNNNNKTMHNQSNINVLKQKQYGKMPDVLKKKVKDTNQFLEPMIQVGQQSSKQQTHQNQNQSQIIENINFTQKQEKIVQKINQKIKPVHRLPNQDRELLKKEMEKVFMDNAVEQDQQQFTIRKKVAQKKAIFADLKAEATKILDTKLQ